MTWFRLDDAAAFDAKVLAAGNEAFGVWCRAGCWSSGKLTDGFVPDEVAGLIAPPKVWKRLEEARAGHEHGLVERRAGGWQIHDFLDWNPSAAETRAKREHRAAAGRMGGLSSGRARSKHEAIASPVASPGANPRPVPSRPDPRSDPPLPPEGGDGASQGELPGMPPPSPPPAPSRPRTRKLREPGSKPERAEDRYREAFVAGIADAAPEEPWSPPQGGFGLPFAQALAAHAQGLAGVELCAWIRRTVAEWRRAAVGAYQRGWSPPAFVVWLNSGRPTKPGNGKPAPTLQQPAKPGEHAWEMPPILGAGKPS